MAGVPTAINHGVVNVLSINELIVSNAVNSAAGTIYKYNSDQDQWIKWLNLPGPDDVYIHSHHATVSDDGRKVYISSDRNCVILDLETKEYDNICAFEDEIPHFPVHARLAHINGVLHMLQSGNGDPGANASEQQHVKHYILGEEERTISELHHFDQFEDISSTTLLPVPSQDCILLIGGLANFFHFDEESESQMVGIWRFCLLTNSWSKVMDFGLKSVQAVLTRDENFVIIAGGSDAYFNTNRSLLVLDIRDKERYKMMQSAMSHVPIPGHYQMAILGLDEKSAELLVVGWIRKLFGTETFENKSLPPLYIMQMISKWVSNEMVHFLVEPKLNPFTLKRDSKGQHIAISVESITSSLSEYVPLLGLGFGF